MRQLLSALIATFTKRLRMYIYMYVDWTEQPSSAQLLVPGEVKNAVKQPRYVKLSF